MPLWSTWSSKVCWKGITLAAMSSINGFPIVIVIRQSGALTLLYIAKA